MDNGKIVKIFQSLETDRKTLDQTFQVIEKFVVPFRGEFFKPQTNEQEVDWRRRSIYDATAVYACQTLSGNIQSSLTSASIKWFNMTFRQAELNEEHEAMEWLEECEIRVYQALQDSNFDLESAEFYMDLTSFGTSILIEEIEDDINWKGIDFQAAPIKDVYFEQNAKGQIKRLFRRIQWTPLQIIDKFGDKVPQNIKEKAESPNQATNKIDIVFCVFDRPGNENANVSGILSAAARPFGYKYIVKEDAELLGEEGGYYEMPAFIARWRKVSGSKWGYSPAFVCLSDILTLNELTEETLEALAKVVDPSTMVTERGLLSDLDLGRGGLTVVRGKEDIWAYESKARFDVGELKTDRLQESINKAYFVDQLQLKESPAMTATEVNARREQMQKLMGPALGRMQNDYLDPLIKRTFNILMRANKLPEMPDVVKEMQGEVDIEYTGPLPRAQKMDVVQSVNQWIGNIAAVAEIFPEALDIPNVDAISRETARLSAVPTKLVNSKDEVKQIRDERKAAQLAAQKAAQVQAEGDAAQSMGAGMSAMKEGAE